MLKIQITKFEKNRGFRAKINELITNLSDNIY